MHSWEIEVPTDARDHRWYVGIYVFLENAQLLWEFPSNLSQNVKSFRSALKAYDERRQLCITTR